MKEALSKAVASASRDGAVLAGGEVSGLIDKALGMGPAGEISTILRQLHAIFAGFDGFSPDEKKGALASALALLGPPMERAIIHEAEGNMKKLGEPLSTLSGIGPRTLERLNKKGLKTIQDLLFFLPIRYEDRRRVTKIRDLQGGGGAQVRGKIAVAGEARYGRKRLFEAVLDDGTGLIRLKWFRYRLSYMKRFTPGQEVLVHGNAERTRYGGILQMIHPEVNFLREGMGPEQEGKGILAVYSEVEGLHQKTLQRIIGRAVRQYAALALGCVPPEALSRIGLKDLPSALMEAHFPEALPAQDRPSKRRGANAHGLALRSLAFDELFLLETAMLLKRGAQKKRRGLCSYHGVDRGDSLESRLRSLLPFRLTGAQERALCEIKADMRRTSSMNRLLEGDVGSGKTLVCLLSALLAVDSGHQAAIMAPTGVLAGQHYVTISAYARKLGIKACLLTGGLPLRERKNRLEAIDEGRVDLVVGTHALIQEDVSFRDLALVVVDEQHRFGVFQRASLISKGMGLEGGASPVPDVLIMTATPIPRTLSMTLFGDLDVSVLDELPPGRQAVKTLVLREKERKRAYEHIRREVRSGGQAYIVYPLVEESEELDLRDATNEKARLEKEVFPGLCLGLLHGRMKGDEKDEVMRRFKDREIDVLVATTVIEVGLDVPNAAVMCIEHAERFGLSQLHQLRGRVGRGERSSYCFLMTENFVSKDAFRRLRVMERNADGFMIAEEDLKIRGPGDYLGQRQSGFTDLRFAWSLMDHGLVRAVRAESETFLKENQDHGEGIGTLIKEVMKTRWKNGLELASVG